MERRYFFFNQFLALAPGQDREAFRVLNLLVRVAEPAEKVTYVLLCIDEGVLPRHYPFLVREVFFYFRKCFGVDGYDELAFFPRSTDGWKESHQRVVPLHVADHHDAETRQLRLDEFTKFTH